MQVLLSVSGFSVERKGMLECLLERAPAILTEEADSLAYHNFDFDCKLFPSTSDAWFWALLMARKTRRSKAQGDDEEFDLGTFMTKMKEGRPGDRNKLNRSIFLAPE